MQRGQGLSPLDVKEVNNWVNNPRALFVFRNSVQKVFCVPSVSGEKFSVLRWWHCYSLKLSILQFLFMTSSSSLVLPSSPSLTAAHFESYAFVEHIFCLPSSWCFSGMRLYHSAASQQEPLFPHLFSLSPLMICSDRYDS